MNDGNQSGNRSDQDLYNDYDPETAELPTIESQPQPLDLSGVPDAPDGYGLPKQVDAITPDSSFAPSTSGIEEFTQYDDTYFDDVERVSEQTRIGAVNVPDEFEFGSDDDADDSHVRFIDERPQGALNGRTLAIIGAVGFVLIASLIAGYTLTRGGGEDGGNEIIAADGTKEDDELLADESETTVQSSLSDNGGIASVIAADPDVSEQVAEQDPASPIASTPQTTTKSGGNVPVVTKSTTTVSSGTTSAEPTTVTTVDDPVTTVDDPATTVDNPATTVEEPTTTTVATVKVTIPNVVGLTAKEAQDALKKAGLVYDSTVVKDALDADGEPLPNNYVISSTPEAGEEVEEGATVEVKVNRATPIILPPLGAAGAVNP